MEVFTQEEIKRLASCNSCYMIGTLATEDDALPGVGDELKPITTMKNSNNMVFYIKPLSPEPLPIMNLLDEHLANSYMSTLYIGIDAYQIQGLLPVDYKFTYDINKKRQMIEDKLKDKLILFRPNINFKSKDHNKNVFKNLEIISVEEDIKFLKSSEYIQVPKVTISNKEFEQRLLNGKNIILEDYNHNFLPTEYIICGDYIYSNFKSWGKNDENNKVWFCNKEPENIIKMEFNINNESHRDKIIQCTDNIIFMDYRYVEENIFFNIETKGVSIGGQDMEEEIILNNNDNKIEEGPKINIESESTANSEYNFLSILKEYTVREQLCYDFKDIVNFHISIKTNPLTILAGMSGTGKTQLALAYSEVLGLSEEDNTLLILPISPSYTEPGDILGYFNNTNGLFMPSETGLTDFLVNASKEENVDKMHMVIFDEMNLSQVEYWFAPFLSLLELKPEQRKLHLYSEKAVCHNSERYPSVINIKSNVIFVGTVNMDETTKDFSDRLLDRANIVVPEKKSFVQLKQEQDNVDNNKKPIKQIMTTHTEYYSWFNNKKSLSAYSIEELEILDELHELIQQYDSQKGVSFRILERIGNYLNNIPKDACGKYLIPRELAFDIQIKQRLLTKIKGTEEQLECLIGTVKKDYTILNSALYNFFDNERIQKISSFSKTKEEIIRKAKELTIYGYTN